MRGRQIALWPGYLSVIAMLLLLGSCGTAQNTTGGSANANTPTFTSTTGTGTPTRTPQTPLPTSPQSTPTPGKVSITLEKGSFAPNEKISATIANGLSSPIRIMDHQSDCTLLTLQRQAGSSWTTQEKCSLTTVTRMILLPAQSSLTQTLSPGNSTPRPEGQYRLTLSYTGEIANVENQQSSSSFTIVYSSTFTVG